MAFFLSFLFVEYYMPGITELVLRTEPAMKTCLKNPWLHLYTHIHTHIHTDIYILYTFMPMCTPSQDRSVTQHFLLKSREK